MGIVRTRSKENEYVIALETHGRDKKSELPVEDLHAVFLETNGGHPPLPEDVEHELNRHGIPWVELYPDTIRKTQTLRDIINRAKESGTEIWLGDIYNPAYSLRGGAVTALTTVAGGLVGYGVSRPLSRRRLLRGLAGLAGAIATSRVTHGEILSSQGNITNRRFSRALIEKTTGRTLDPRVDLRNRVMSDKIKLLAKVTGHSKIGVNVGAFHAGLISMLEKTEPALTREEKKQLKPLAWSEEGTLRAYRCIYDKKKGKWKHTNYN